MIKMKLRPIIDKNKNKEHLFKRLIRWFGYFLFVVIIVGGVYLIWFR